MMLSKSQFATYVRTNKFRELFNELGWNKDKSTYPIIVDGQTYLLRSVAVKSGFKILVCDPDSAGQIPDYNIRKKIETKVTRLFQEHLIIFADAKQKEQIWQLVMRQTGKSSKLTETRYFTHQEPELLYQKASGLVFQLDEEDNITIVDVTQRVTENFHQNAEKVTKQFYERFKKEHGSFYDFISGIDDHIDEWNKTRKKGEQERENKAKQWYVSLMLNRLMFCYFIQKKGFLDGNKDYLREKLKESKAKKGKDKFYSFYRDFLLVLFHEGLNDPNQKKKIQEEIGTIPYLNGGLFDEHELEKQFKEIEIEDKAFERIFNFFDDYEWHLDTREQSSGREINPDVIGYIFEKYINDRAQMGAYYTKEDITDYISKNCIIPWLFDEVARKYPRAFDEDAEIWLSLKESTDTYIYPAVKFGVNEKLPSNIAKGIKDVNARADWNKPASDNIGLPTEIWREVIERRSRYKDTLEKIETGAIRSINDFITYNLDIREFTQDVISNTNDPEFLKAIYKALCSVTILDPTCGSGAFLFAAMNVLEPLYYACILRMRGFTEDEDRSNADEHKKFSNKYKFFRQILENIQSDQHPNTEYFIYKSIILNNLYGVDIMREAVEIAKLRLFLKLVGTVEANYDKPNLGLEPLPDIDFNIRAGNTLIGFATYQELKKGGSYTFDFDNQMPVIEEKCEIVAKAFARYKEIQLSYGDEFKEFKKAKSELHKRLGDLNASLNKLLHKQAYGIKFEEWLEIYQPFHWFAEFYEIIHDKRGFDIVIGNPPYIEYSKIPYKIKDYATVKCGNVYAFVVERCLKLLTKYSRFGMIVPIASICTDRMIDYQKLLLNKDCWNSLFAERPSKLFTGAEVQLVISLLRMEGGERIFSTTYNKWGADYRENLFDAISYVQINDLVRKGSFPKVGKIIEKSILNAVGRHKKAIGLYQTKNSNNFVSYRNAGGRYYKVILNYEPEFKVNGEIKRSSTYQFLYFQDIATRDAVCAIMNSTLFFWYWLIYSDTWHMVNREISTFQIDLDDQSKAELSKLNRKLMKNIELNGVNRKESRNKGKDIVEFTQYNIRESKTIIDDIDRVLARVYKFNNEELDYILNYDIKYRMGKDNENED